MKSSFKPILIALIFAILIISSSYVLKGNPIGDWVDAGIYMIGAYFFFKYSATSPKVCSAKSHNSI
jgi:hypothetical protein